MATERALEKTNDPTQPNPSPPSNHSPFKSLITPKLTLRELISGCTIVAVSFGWYVDKNRDRERAEALEGFHSNLLKNAELSEAIDFEDLESQLLSKGLTFADISLDKDFHQYQRKDSFQYELKTNIRQISYVGLASETLHLGYSTKKLDEYLHYLDEYYTLKGVNFQSVVSKSDVEKMRLEFTKAFVLLNFRYLVDPKCRSLHPKDIPGNIRDALKNCPELSLAELGVTVESLALLERQYWAGKAELQLESLKDEATSIASDNALALQFRLGVLSEHRERIDSHLQKQKEATDGLVEIVHDDIREFKEKYDKLVLFCLERIVENAKKIQLSKNIPGDALFRNHPLDLFEVEAEARSQIVKLTDVNTEELQRREQEEVEELAILVPYARELALYVQRLARVGQTTSVFAPSVKALSRSFQYFKSLGWQEERIWRELQVDSEMEDVLRGVLDGGNE